MSEVEYIKLRLMYLKGIFLLLTGKNLKIDLGTKYSFMPKTGVHRQHVLLALKLCADYECEGFSIPQHTHYVSNVVHCSEG